MLYFLYLLLAAETIDRGLVFLRMSVPSLKEFLQNDEQLNMRLDRNVSVMLKCLNTAYQYVSWKLYD